MDQFELNRKVERLLGASKIERSWSSFLSEQNSIAIWETFIDPVTKKITFTPHSRISEAERQWIIKRSELRWIEADDHERQQTYAMKEVDWEMKYSVQRADKKIEIISKEEYDEAMKRIKEFESRE